MSFAINFGFLVFLGIGIGVCIFGAVIYVKHRVFRKWEYESKRRSGVDERSGMDRRRSNE